MRNMYAVESIITPFGALLAEKDIDTVLNEPDVRVCIRKLEDLAQNARRRLPKRIVDCLYEVIDSALLRDPNELRRVIERADDTMVPHRLHQLNSTEFVGEIEAWFEPGTADYQIETNGNLDEQVQTLLLFVQDCILRQDSNLGPFVRLYSEILVAHARNHPWASTIVAAIDNLDAAVHTSEDERLNGQLRRWELERLLHSRLTKSRKFARSLLSADWVEEAQERIRTTSIYEITFVARTNLTKSNFLKLFDISVVCEYNIYTYVRYVLVKVQQLRADFSSICAPSLTSVRELTESEFIDFLFDELVKKHLAIKMTYEDLQTLIRTNTVVSLRLSLAEKKSVYWPARIAQKIASLTGRSFTSIRLYNNDEKLSHESVEHALIRKRQKPPRCQDEVAKLLDQLDGVKLIRQTN